MLISSSLKCLVCILTATERHSQHRACAYFPSWLIFKRIGFIEMCRHTHDMYFSSRTCQTTGTIININVLQMFLLMSSADILGKLFGTLMAFLKEFFEKVDL